MAFELNVLVVGISKGLSVWLAGGDFTCPITLLPLFSAEPQSQYLFKSIDHHS